VAVNEGVGKKVVDVGGEVWGTSVEVGRRVAVILNVLVGATVATNCVIVSPSTAGMFSLLMVQPLIIAKKSEHSK